MVSSTELVPINTPKKRGPGTGKGMSKFDASHKKIVLKAKEKGLPTNHCAHLASMEPNTVYNWLARGRECDENGNPLEPKYQKFLLDFKFAEAKWVESRLDLIDEAAKQNWQAAAWQLERRFPNEFGRKERVDLTAEEPIKVQLSW